MNRNVRIAIGVTIILISIARFWNIKQQQKERQQQLQMINDLSNQQLQERIDQGTEIELPSITGQLDSIQKGLEETGKNLEELGERIEALSGD